MVAYSKFSADQKKKKNSNFPYICGYLLFLLKDFHSQECSFFPQLNIQNWKKTINIYNCILGRSEKFINP